MNIRDLKGSGTSNKPIRLIHSDTIEKKRALEKEEESDLKEMKAITFKTVDNSSKREERVAMDIEKDVPVEKVGGVDIKESLEAEIFGSGGPFEKYKQEKLKEALQFMEEQKAEAEMDGKKIVEGGVDLKPIVPAEDIEQSEIDSVDEFGDPIKKPKTESSNIVQFQTSQNDPKFKFKIQEDDIFD